jgi:tRNA dimethylallyltransferase
MNSRTVDAVMLIGPTASGKTAASFELSEIYPSEIISVDSALVYRHMDIGTAKPTKEELSRVPHHLIDILEPEESYSAASFCKDAETLIADISGRGRLPLLVGGTMLYVKSFLDGMSDIPASTPEIRARVAEELQKDGLPSLYGRLQAADPATAARLKPADTQRISRALEVWLMTGRPLSDYLGAKKGTEKRILQLGLMPSDRAYLHSQIEKRFDLMLEQGFLDEVRELIKRPGLNEMSASVRCVGYRQGWDYLKGRCSYEEFRNAAVAATRQLAKRQMTWMRSMSGLKLIDTCAPDFLDRIKKEVEQAVSTS